MTCSCQTKLVVIQLRLVPSSSSSIGDQRRVNDNRTELCSMKQRANESDYTVLRAYAVERVHIQRKQRRDRTELRCMMWLTTSL